MKGLINRRSERFKSRQGIRWEIARKNDNVIIGSCGYGYKNPFLGELGYELARAYWRQGIMTEALEAAIKFGFQAIELRRS